MKILLLLVAATTATPLLAQAPLPLPSATPTIVPDVLRTTSILDAMTKAGPIMVPLILLSVFSVMLVIVDLMTIRRGALVSTGYMATPDALLPKRDYLGLLAVSNRR